MMFSDCLPQNWHRSNVTSVILHGPITQEQELKDAKNVRHDYCTEKDTPEDRPTQAMRI
jgi:hypothetical protein